MSTQTSPHTYSVEAQHARELRVKRDLTDTEIRRDFIQPVTAERLAVERAKATNTRRNWERDTIESAVGRVIRAFLAEGGELRYNDDVREFELNGGPIRDLEGVTLTATPPTENREDPASA